MLLLVQVAQALGLISLLLLCFVYIEKSPLLENKPSVQRFLTGCSLGVLVVVAMLDPIKISEGAIFDPRGGPAILAGIFAGPLGALITNAIGALARWYVLGGPVALGGVISFMLYGVFGAIAGIMIKKYNWKIGPKMLISIGMLGSIFVLPSFFVSVDFATGLVILKKAGLIFLTNNILSCLLVGVLLVQARAWISMKNTLEQQNQQNQFLSRIVNETKNGVVITDEQGLTEWVNPAFEKMSGYTLAELAGRAPGDVLQRSDINQADVQLMHECIENQEPFDVTVANHHKKGHLYWVHITCQPFTKVVGKSHFMAIQTDVTEHMLAIEELQRNETLLKGILECVPGMVNVKDTEFRYTYMNAYQAAVYNTTTEQAIGKTATDILGSEHGEKIAKMDLEVVSTGKPTRQYEDTLVDHDGRASTWLSVKVPVHDRQGNLSLIVSSGINISDRKELEDQLRQAHRMEAIGQLTGGVAHDFNNLMAIIMGNVEAAMQKIGRSHPSTHNLEKALNAVGRGAALTQQLLTFSRRQALFPINISVQDAITETLTLLEPTLGTNIQIETHYDETELIIALDEAIFGNAVVNLALNSRDAMPDGGVLTITVTKTNFTGEILEVGEEPAYGPYAHIKISDTGSGISPNELDRVLEPFYSTKAVGKGSGLGLSMVYGFVHQSNGYLSIDSTIGEGTNVSIYLPIVQIDEAPTHASPDQELTANALENNKHILVVEDNQLVRETLMATLAYLGYGVTEATDGAAALEVVEQESEAIALVISDIVMPGIYSGVDIAKKITQEYPDIKVLLVSGYQQNSTDLADLNDAGIVMLSKPYSREDLIEKINHLLSE